MRIRTGYSFKTAFGHVPDVLSRLTEIGWEFAPITDRMSTFGFTKWSKACEAAGLKPVYGVEIPCVVELGEKRPITDMWTFIAKDSLRDLHELIRVATANPGKEPTLTYEQALKTAAGRLFVIGGERLRVDYLPAAHDGFFGALGPSTSKGLYRAMCKANVPLVATSDNFYPRAEDRELYRVALGFRSNTQTYPMHILSDDELFAYLRDELEIEEGYLHAAFDNRDAISIEAKAKPKKAKLLVPEKPKPLREMCVEGAQARGIDLSDPVYEERLERELKVIHEKAFEDYFYILADIVAFARPRMVVGPARGSSCGSLVCYLLGITSIDPIPYGLIFERFIDYNRMDLPDVDVDFSDARRDIVFKYAEDKFGRERVARLGTVGLFKAKSALNQAGASLKIPKWKIEKLAEITPERADGDARALKTLEDALTTDEGKKILAEHPEISIVTRIEGHPSIPSQHAAGLLLTDEPMVEYVAMDSLTRAAWCDKKDAETLNLLKIDALGLTQLSIFERCLELMGERQTAEFLERLPLDDQAAFDVLNQRRYSGIFQIAGQAVRGLADQLAFDRLDDLVAISALARPGPLGQAQLWVDRRMGRAPVEGVHPLLADLTAETYGIVIYQETVMMICREIGKFTWAEVAEIRRLISKTMGDEAFAKWGDKFRAGAVESGMNEHEAQSLWQVINTYGGYAFNKSHALAYGVVSYWCCWLKAHYPVEFAAATLDAEGNVEKQLAMLRELAAEGVSYVPVDPARSEARWAISERDGRKVLIGPLTTVKGIGPAAVTKILDCRKTGAALPEGIAKKLNNPKTEIDNLFPIQARIAELYPDLSAPPLKIETEILPIAEAQPGKRGDVVILGKITRLVEEDENHPDKVKKRGGKVWQGPTKVLTMFVQDDTGEIFVKVGRFAFEDLAPKIREKCKVGSLVAFKGEIPRGFRMLDVLNFRYVGEMEDTPEQPPAALMAAE